jgi:hypothetical protein
MSLGGVRISQCTQIFAAWTLRLGAAEERKETGLVALHNFVLLLHLTPPNNRLFWVG